MRKPSVLTLLTFLFLSARISAQAPELRIPTAHHAEESRFSNDDKLLITWAGSEIKIWDVAGQFLLKTLTWKGLDTLGLNSVAMYFLPGQQQAFVHATGEIRKINLQSLDWEGGRMLIPELDNTALSPDGKWLYGIDFDGHNDKNILYKIDLGNGKATQVSLFSYDDNGESVYITGDMEVSADGTRALANGHDEDGMVFDLTTGKTLLKGKNRAPLFFLPNGNIIALTKQKETTTGQSYLIEELDGSFKSIRKSSLTVKYDNTEGGTNIVWVSHDHHSKLLFENNTRFYLFDVASWSATPQRQSSAKIDYGQGYSPKISDGGKYLFDGSAMLCFSPETGNTQKTLGFFPYSPFNLSTANYANDSGMFVGYKHLHFNPKGFQIDILPILKGCETFDYVQRSIYRAVPSQNAVLMTGGNEFPDNYSLKRYQLGDDTAKVSPFIVGGSFLTPSTMDMRSYDDNNTVLGTDSDRLYTLDSRTGKIKQYIVFEDDYHINHFERHDEHYVIARGNTERSLVVANLKKDGNEGQLLGRIACFDLAKQKQVWAYDEKEPFGNPVFAENDQQVWVINQKGSLLKLDAKTGKVISKSDKIPFADGYSDICPSAQFITTYHSTEEIEKKGLYLTIYNAKTLKPAFSIPTQRVPFKGFIFINKDRFLVTYDEDLKIWDTNTGKMMARIILIGAGADWIVSSPDGRFDGSAGGLKQMYYIKGREYIPLEQLYEGFYTPNLLYEIMSGNSSTSSVPVNLNNLKLPPTVRIVNKATGLRNLSVVDEENPSYISTQKTVTLSVEGDGRELPVTELRLYQNGKLLTDGTRSFKPVAGGSGNKIQRDFEVSLVVGENRFRAVAINSQRTESRPEEILIQYQATVEEKKTLPAITLHLVVIGINQYKNSKYNLNYAQADAQSIKEQLTKNCGVVVGECKQYYLLNDQAVKSGITKTLEQVSASAKPEDVFVLYYAGHGVMTENREFYLVPYDVTQIYGDEGSLASKGVSAQELKEFSTQIKAQKQLFILDACQSSGALETITARGAAEEKAISQLARATGTHWLAAAGSEQYASEFTQLGHGVFTYALLEGFNGAADNNSDGKITVKEMDAYLQDQVPVLTEKYKGTAQYPSSYGFGQDFPLGIKNKK